MTYAFYLRYRIQSGPDAGTLAYIGPFPTQPKAKEYCSAYGPAGSDVIVVSAAPEPASAVKIPVSP